VDNNQQMRLPLPMPTPSTGIADSSLLAATAEYEETKIRLLGDIHLAISKIGPVVSSISQVLSKDFALAQKKSGEELEARREAKQPEQKSKTLKEIEEQGKGFWTLITAFFIPAILGFVSTIVDMTTPFGLLKGAVLGLVTFFASRKLLSLLAGSIKLMFSKIASLFMAKIIVPLGAMLAKTAIGQKIGGMFNQAPSAPSGSPSAGPAKTGAPGKAGGILKSITGSGLLKGAGAMLLAAGAIFVLGEALEKFSNLKWETLAVAGTAVVGLGTAVAILGKFSPLIISGSLALAAMGAALIPLAAALALTTPFLWGLGEVLDAVSGVIDSVVGGIVSVLETVSMLDPVQVLAAAGAITALSGALLLLGAGSLVSGLLSLFSGNPIEDLIELGNVAPNIVELAEVMADFGNIVEFFNDALDNLNGDAAVQQFTLIRDGILMVGKALDEVSMIKLVAFSALSKISASKPVVSETLPALASNVSDRAADVGGYARTVDSVSGTLKMGQPSGPIVLNGKTINPGDEDYPRAAEALIKSARQMDNFDSNFEDRREQRLNRIRNNAPQATATGSSRTSMMGDLNSSVTETRTRTVTQPQMMSVNNVNSVNKSETNYKSTSMGAALQGDALRYVY